MNEYEILKKKLEEKERKYNTAFGVSLVFSTSGSVSVGDFEKNRKITMEELSELIFKYSQLDALVGKLTEETNIKY